MLINSIVQRSHNGITLILPCLAQLVAKLLALVSRLNGSDTELQIVLN